MQCRTARTWIVANRDDELGARRRRALDRHLASCPSCRSERMAIEDVLTALDGLAPEAEVPARLEQNVMRRVRTMADEPSGGVLGLPSRWLRGLAPGLAAAAVAAVAMVSLRADLDGGAPVRTVPVAVARDAAVERPVLARRSPSRIPDEPPPALASQPDLFVDLPVLRNMDKLQHFEAIATMEGDDSTDGGAPPSNG